MTSIARAFTLRRKRHDSGFDAPGKEGEVPALPSNLQRASTARHNKHSVDITKISGPVELLSTTNMLTYNAPDVAVVRAQRQASGSVSSVSSAASDNDDASSTSSRSRDTHMTDASSVGSVSPVSSPNDDKKMTFDIAPTARASSTLRRSMSTLEVRQQSLADDLPPRSESPAIPQRHPSHSKKASLELAKKRSMQFSSSTSMSRAHSIATPPALRSTSSNDYFSSTITSSPVPSITTTPPAATHPFGRELEQLDEVAEEFQVVANDAERAADLQAMNQRGLFKFCAMDYISEIEPLFSSYVHTHLSAPQVVGWI